VKWKVEIPYRGWSTPAIMRGQVWLTTATEDGHDFFVICLDAKSGQVLHNEKIFHSDNPEPLGNPVNSYATPSPVVETGRVYVSFGSYGTACLDTSNFKTLWKRDDLPCSHYRGPSSSPVRFGDLLILTLDGADLQYTVALNKDTGQTVWKADRTTLWNPSPAPGKDLVKGDFHKAHSTPLVATVAGQPLLLSADGNGDFAYDPRTGAEIWKVHHTDYSAAPCPLFDHGLAIFVTGLSKTEMWAVKPGGKGDVTASDIVWKLSAHVGKYASPIVVDDLLYTAAEESFLSCVNVENGEVVWTERLGGTFEASPVYADGRLYFCNLQGATAVLKPGRTCEVLATNTLADGMMASPAVADGALFLRTKAHLYRIEAAAPAGN
jgi:outer membrane protein assembly factor BamB